MLIFDRRLQCRPACRRSRWKGAEKLDRERPILFYCRSGSRSALAAQAFAAAGFEAHNLHGGLQEWVKDGLPIEPADGHVA